MLKKSTVLAIVGIIVVSISVIIPQYYFALHPGPNLNWEDFVYAVVVPTILAFLFFGLGKQPVLIYACLGYIIAVSEDAPVYLDSVFTWPEVTSGLQHTFLEILLHLMTALFIYLAVRQALKGRIGPSRKFVVYVLAVVAFVASYAQNLPIGIIEQIVKHSWFQLDVAEHFISFGFFSLAIVIANRMKKAPKPDIRF
jgi:hypothetical protein